MSLQSSASEWLDGLLNDLADRKLLSLAVWAVLVGAVIFATRSPEVVYLLALAHYGLAIHVMLTARRDSHAEGTTRAGDVDSHDSPSYRLEVLE